MVPDEKLKICIPDRDQFFLSKGYRTLRKIPDPLDGRRSRYRRSRRCGEKAGNSEKEVSYYETEEIKLMYFYEWLANIDNRRYRVFAMQV